MHIRVLKRSDDEAIGLNGDLVFLDCIRGTEEEGEEGDPHCI